VETVEPAPPADTLFVSGRTAPADTLSAARAKTSAEAGVTTAEWALPADTLSAVEAMAEVGAPRVVPLSVRWLHRSERQGMS
jgi:hypothetical protein